MTEHSNALVSMDKCPMCCGNGSVGPERDPCYCSMRGHDLVEEIKWLTENGGGGMRTQAVLRATLAEMKARPALSSGCADGGKESASEAAPVAWQARTHPDAPWFNVPLWDLKATKEHGAEVRALYAEPQAEAGERAEMTADHLAGAIADMLYDINNGHDIDPTERALAILAAAK